MSSAPPARDGVARRRMCPHCGASHPGSWAHCPITGKELRAESSIGRTVSERYRITGILGEGGMGTVFRAEHLGSGRVVALKQLRPEQTADPVSLERFGREARAATATGHKNVVELLDVGFDDDGAPFIVMELLAGMTLAERLTDAGSLAADECAEIACQILSGLGAVHKQKVIHRDLKPGNIFLTPHGIKILDFGISKFHADGPIDEPTITKTGATMGTPYYLSPEQARGARVIDHRADLYALGVILYEALGGERPFASDNYHALLRKIIGGAAPKLGAKAPTAPPALCEAIHRAMHPDPRLRFQSAEQMSEAFNGFRPSSAPTAWSSLRASTPPPRPSTPPKTATPQSEERTSLVAREAVATYGDSDFASTYNAKVKGRLILALERYSPDLKMALKTIDVQLPLSWVSQEDLERSLVVVNFDTLRSAGASAAESLMENLPWAPAPARRALGRLPALHRAFFSGNDIVVEGTDLCFSGIVLGPRLSEVMAGFYEYALGRAEVGAAITIRADRLVVAIGA